MSDNWSSLRGRRNAGRSADTFNAGGQSSLSKRETSHGHGGVQHVRRMRGGGRLNAGACRYFGRMPKFAITVGQLKEVVVLEAGHIVGVQVRIRAPVRNCLATSPLRVHHSFQHGTARRSHRHHASLYVPRKRCAPAKRHKVCTKGW